MGHSYDEDFCDLTILVGDILYRDVYHDSFPVWLKLIFSRDRFPSSLVEGLASATSLAGVRNVCDFGAIAILKRGGDRRLYGGYGRVG